MKDRGSRKSRGQRPRTTSEQPSAPKTSLGGKLRQAGITVAGPICLSCGEPIDVRSTRANGNVSQGWVHGGCLPWAEAAERSMAELEPAFEEPKPREYVAKSLKGLSFP
jgi:hypothetical protein